MQDDFNREKKYITKHHEKKKKTKQESKQTKTIRLEER